MGSAAGRAAFSDAGWQLPVAGRLGGQCGGITPTGRLAMSVVYNQHRAGGLGEGRNSTVRSSIAIMLLSGAIMLLSGAGVVRRR